MSMPDFSDGELSNNLPMMTLKSRCAASKPLGIVRFDNGKKEELLVVYDGAYLFRATITCHPLPPLFDPTTHHHMISHTSFHIAVW